MSVGKKIVDGARAGLGSLLDKIRADAAPLQGGAADDLERELAARKALRARRGEPRPEDNPRARDAAGGAEAARRRAQAAEVRGKKLNAAREAARRAEEEAARKVRDAARASDDAFHRFRDDVRSGRVNERTTRPSGGAGAGGGASAGTGGGARSARPFFGSSEKIAKAYKTLDLPDGASFDEVKSRYRKLMRKYHPDMHTANPQKQKAATELSMQVTQAYNLLDEHLNKKGR